MAQLQEVVSRRDFQEEVLKSPDPVAVIFFGKDDNSTHLEHTFQRLADEYAGRVKFVLLDIRVAELLYVDHHIRPSHTPTVMLFLAGERIGRWGNEQNPDVYRHAFDQAIERQYGG